MPEGFACEQCGMCCQNLSIKPEEARRLYQLAGERREALLKKLTLCKGQFLVIGWCPFLQRNGEKAACTIYESRPEVCRWYPPPRLASYPQCRAEFEDGSPALTGLLLRLQG